MKKYSAVDKQTMATNSMQQRLGWVELNLAALEAIKDHDKLRILPNSPDGEATPDHSIASHHIAIDERMFMPVRRHFTGDGHAISIAFIRQIIGEVRTIANAALQRDTVLLEPAAMQEQTIFDDCPRKVLHRLSCLCTSAKSGIGRLRNSTYADSQQIGVELADIGREMDKIIVSIANYLADVKAR